MGSGNRRAAGRSGSAVGLHIRGPRGESAAAGPAASEMFLPFDEIIRLGARRSSDVYNAVVRFIHNMSVLIVVAVIIWVPLIQTWNAHNPALVAERAAEQAEQWPRGKVVQEYNDARAYNRSIAVSGQFSMGETVDPFLPQPKHAKTASQKDATYQSVLAGKDGVMGTVRVPKISLRLPIYHGTAPDVLEHGAGHLYGTSVPVGGKSTNSVLTGHRGVPNALLFTRLDELKHGDVIYIQTLRRTIGYRVTSIPCGRARRHPPIQGGSR